MQHRYSTRFVAMLQNKLHVFVAHWVILENIHTIPWMAQGNSEGKAGNTIGTPKAWWGDRYGISTRDRHELFLENAFEKANIQTGRRLTIMEF